MIKRLFFLFIVCSATRFACGGIYSAQAAELYAGSAYEQIHEGQDFSVEWYLDTQGESINTIDITLEFTSETLEVTDVSYGNSLVNLWVQQPIYDNTSGTIQLTGASPGGWANTRVPLFRTSLKAVRAGKADIRIRNTSRVLKNDGNGTAATLQFKPVVFDITRGGERSHIHSPTHPDPTVWYRINTVNIVFDAQESQQYSYSFSSNLDMLPDDQPENVVGTVNYTGVPDGIYYFRLNTKNKNQDWQPAGIFRVQVDTTPPEAFTPTIAVEPTLFEGKPFLSFFAVDKGSGVSYFKIKKWKWGKWEIAQSPYKLQAPLVGNTLLLRSYDKAGNYREVSVEYPGIISEKVLLGTMLGVLLVVLLYGAWRALRKRNSESGV